MNKKYYSYLLGTCIVLTIYMPVLAGTNPAETIKNTSTGLPQDNETVWWNTTELSSEPYTAPFFEVYRLIDFGQAVYGLDVADFNHDAQLDFAVTWATSPFEQIAGINIFYKESFNSFRIETIKLYTHYLEDLECADFNGDGDVDIIYSIVLDGENDAYEINIIWNENNTFITEQKVAHFTRADGYWINPHITTADFDVDGDVDLLVGANCGKVKFFKNDGAGNFTDEGVIFDYGTVSWGLDAGDFNQDGYPDFIVCARTEPGEYPFNDAGHIYLKLNDHTSTCFDTSTPGILITSIPFPFDYTIGAGRFGSIAVFDYNNDGHMDVVYAGDYKIFLLIQQEDGRFKPFYAVGLRGRELDWSDRLHTGGFTIGDVNEDGWDDVIAGGVQGVVRLLINNHTFVNIVKPEDRLLYFFGNDDYSLKFPGRKVVVGDIEVVAEALEPISRVDFSVDDQLVKSDTEEPFSWNWTSWGFGSYQMKAEAYDRNGDFAGRDTFIIWKFL